MQIKAEFMGLLAIVLCCVKFSLWFSTKKIVENGKHLNLELEAEAGQIGK